MTDILTLAERLTEIRMRGYENGARGAHAARLSDCAAIDIPRLLVAVDATLTSHVKIPGGPLGVGYCPTCMRIWPCQTYKNIRAALLGGTDGHNDH